jgi:gamma-glutamylcyclotransferase (GGCT)/AIG2-like uncharacterized protein YtfP
MWPFDRNKKMQQLVQSFAASHPYTKDFADLETSQHRLMFVHDDMKVGHANHHLLKDAKKVVRGFSQDHFDYRVGKFTGKAVPFAVNKQQGLKVKGDVYAVETRHIPAIDSHYRNGVEFARIRLNIIMIGRDQKLMSIGNEEFLKELPPGMIHTLPEFGTRRYISDTPRVHLIGAYMYVAMKSHWDEADVTLLPNPLPQFPPHELIWLPKYYRYPIERNKCLK